MTPQEFYDATRELVKQVGESAMVLEGFRSISLCGREVEFKIRVRFPKDDAAPSLVVEGEK